MFSLSIFKYCDILLIKIAKKGGSILKISKIWNIIRFTLFGLGFIFLMTGNSNLLNIALKIFMVIIPLSIIEYLMRISTIVDKKVKKLEEEENES